jgi:hypothetical protein
MDGRLFNDWCCPECQTFLSPAAISQSEAKSLLDAHKLEDCYKPRRQRKTTVPCTVPGCIARPREDHLLRHLEKHRAKMAQATRRAAEPLLPRWLPRPESKPNVASPKPSERQLPALVPPSAGPMLSEHPKPASPEITVPPPADVAAAQPHGNPGSYKEVKCKVCYWIMPSGHLSYHLKHNCPGRAGAVAHFPFRLLPPGVWDVGHIREYYSNEARHWLGGRSVDDERLRKIERLKPSRCSVGTEGQLGYILFEFPWSRAVVLECPVEGNATYILWGDWHGMLRLTKSELRRKPNCLRVIHTGRSFGRVIAALDRQKPGTAPEARA